MPRTYICPKCGQEFTTKAAMEGHDCISTNSDTKMQATIPLSALPPEIKYLSRGKLVALRVMGKFDGDKVLINDVKLL
jgi:hypothetical protein